jgi:23S rRNA (pseudouridine1915-N3)-methyltransferase
MQIKILAIGKTDDKSIKALMEQYEKRLKHYIKMDWEIIPDIKNAHTLSFQQQKEKEGQLLLQKINPSDYVVLFDENGKHYTSLGFSDWIQKKMNASTRTLVFVIGGPYGFSLSVYERSNELLSLSKMTFSHQMIRIFISEQIYRAFTILKNEPYHHE